jgi:hypothetical protein
MAEIRVAANRLIKKVIQLGRKEYELGGVLLSALRSSHD